MLLFTMLEPFGHVYPVEVKVGRKVMFQRRSYELARVVHDRFPIKACTKAAFYKLRSLPLATKDKVSDDLNRLVKEGIVKQRVNFPYCAAPIVPVRKGDGNIRVCDDYKITINTVMYQQ